MPFDRQPVLNGELVSLRPLLTADYDDLCEVAEDPLIWEQHPDKNRYQENEFSIFFADAVSSGGALLVLDSKSDDVIGTSRFHGYDEEKSEIEIGWTFLARSHWGGAYNKEMKDLMMAHAFQFVDHVLFFVGPENMRSQRAVEKLGAVKIDERPDRDRCVYQITASMFAEQQK